MGIDEDCDGSVDEGCSCPLYVDPNAVGSNETGTYDDPYLDITDAFDDLVSGCEELNMMPGTYTDRFDEDISNAPDESLVLRSVDGPATTIYDLGGTRECIKVEKGHFILDGFTLRNGQGGKGAGLKMDQMDSAEVTNCVIELNNCNNDGLGAGTYIKNSTSVWIHGNTYQDNDCDYGGDDGKSDGGGIYAEDSDLLIEDNEFLSNLAGDGAGLYLLDCTGILHHNLIFANLAGDTQPGNGDVHGGGGLAIFGGSMTFNNNLVLENVSDDQGGGYYFVNTNGAPSVINDTIAGNTSATGGAGIHLGANGDFILHNTIIAFNDGDAGIDSDGDDPVQVHVTAGAVEVLVQRPGVDPLGLERGDDETWIGLARQLIGLTDETT